LMERKQRLIKQESDLETKSHTSLHQQGSTSTKKQLKMTVGKFGAKGHKGKNHEADLVARLVTRMVSSSRFPGAYDAVPPRTCRRRWISSPTVQISSQDFQIAFGHRQFLVVVSVAGTSVAFVDMWRIKSLTVWTTSYVDNPTTCEIRPAFQDTADNCFNDRESVFSISSRSEAEAGHMKIVPARDTPMGSWHKTSNLNPTGPLFNMNVNNGGASSGNWATTTLDMEFEYIENLVGANPGYTFTSLVTSLGTMGGCSLFGQALLLQDINVLN